MELVSYLADVTARSLALAALILLGLWLFRVKQPAARHAALTMLTAGMLVLAALTAALPSLPLRVLRAEPAAQLPAQADLWADQAVPMPAVAAHPVAHPSRPRAPLANLQWPLVASVAYFAVAFVLLLRLAYGYLFTLRLVRDSLPAGEVHESAWISVPMTVGCLRPKILLPASWKDWNPAKLNAVLVHERMHIRRGDWAIAALAAVNRSVFWFNPLAWWVERKLAALAEQACDDAALLETGARETYAEALLDMAAAVRSGKGRMVWEAMAMARTAEVRNRIERILDESRQIPRGLTRGRWAALVACSLPVMVVAAAVRLAPARTPEAQPQAAPVEIAQAAAVPLAASSMAAAPAPAQEQPPLATETQYADRRLVVLYFDLQGLGADDLARVRNNARTFVGSHIGDRDRTAVMIDSGGVKVVQDFTDNRSLVTQRIESLPGSAAGVENSEQQLESLETAVKMLRALPEKKALIYFGGGASRGAGDAQLRSTIDAAMDANVAFYPVDASGLQTEVAETVVRASAQAPYPYRLTRDATPLQKVDPVYPPEALAAGFEGVVHLDIVVGTDGQVKGVKSISGPSCAGNNCGAQEMVTAAREAVSHYLYEPAKAPNGEPAEMETMVMVPFRLRGVVTGQPSMDTLNEIRSLTQNYQAQYGRGVADSGADHPARVLSKVDPEYPYALRAQGHQGTVTLAVTVGVDGAAKDIRVVRSDPELDAAAVAAVRQWRFTPARKDGQPVESTVTAPISFRLE